VEAGVAVLPLVEARAGGRGGAALELAGQKPAGQRRPRQDAEAVAGAGGRELELEVADDEAVLGLEADVAGQPLGLAGVQALDEAVGGVVAATDVEDLAGADEVVEGAQGLLLGRVA